MRTAMRRVRSDTGCVGSGICAVECGVIMKCVIADCTVPRDVRRSDRGGDRDTDLSFACTERGDGGLTTTTGPAGGVGGYECCSRDAPSMSVMSESVDCFVSIEGRPSSADVPLLLLADGRFVLHANESAASA